jgi:PAS domain-containing protein
MESRPTSSERMRFDMATRPRSLVLILARDLADKLASAAFIVDDEGTLVYFNERCSEILGMPFAEAGPMPMDRWSRDFNPTDLEGRPLDPDEVPLMKALKHRKPTHRTVRIQAVDGEARDIAVTALPLFAHADEFVGAIALFWEHVEPNGKA